ncbi:hypothetical protein N657DRAFT_228849 [Parathielavia appendiculata]|uniref:Uncharacterized protein n=1 Tax=Parathielavia appendiculata TaxID=2587402 RepID=A0AAN6U7Y7_9PEZI|nr:hypothetical protein N657DRAFT_228849 [Parathielavia appendiculata]
MSPTPPNDTYWMKSSLGAPSQTAEYGPREAGSPRSHARATSPMVPFTMPPRADRSRFSGVDCTGGGLAATSETGSSQARPSGRWVSTKTSPATTVVSPAQTFRSRARL